MIKFLLAFSLVALTPTYSFPSTCHALFEGKETKKILTPEFVKRYFIKLPLIAALSAVAWHQFDQHVFWPAAENKVTTQILNRTEHNKKFYDDLIAKDFKFHEIQNAELDFKIRHQDPRLKSLEVQKRMRAYNLKRNYDNYYELYRKLNGPFDLTLKQQFEYFGDNPLFEHLKFFFENGVKQYEGTIVEKKYQGPLSDEQKKTLFELTHMLYTKYMVNEILFARVSNETSKELIDNYEIANDIFYDPYVQQLILLEKGGKITKEQMLYFIQEDAFNQYYMDLFKTLHITNLKSKDGEYTNEPLTLDDLRKSRMESIK